MTHVMALKGGGGSGQGTFEPITPGLGQPWAYLWLRRLNNLVLKYLIGCN